MWEKIKKFFKDSEVIFLARAQVVIGAVGATVLALLGDANISQVLQSILKPTYVPYYIIGIGFLTEYLRRRRADM